nr:Chain B, Acetyl-coenzyme A synthetase 2-like, mitochondrial [Homo sapiens]
TRSGKVMRRLLR